MSESNVGHLDSKTTLTVYKNDGSLELDDHNTCMRRTASDDIAFVKKNHNHS